MCWASHPQAHHSHAHCHLPQALAPRRPQYRLICWHWHCWPMCFAPRRLQGEQLLGVALTWLPMLSPPMPPEPPPPQLRLELGASARCLRQPTALIPRRVEDEAHSPQLGPTKGSLRVRPPVGGQLRIQSTDAAAGSLARSRTPDSSNRQAPTSSSRPHAPRLCRHDAGPILLCLLLLSRCRHAA